MKPFASDPIRETMMRATAVRETAAGRTIRVLSRLGASKGVALQILAFALWGSLAAHAQTPTTINLTASNTSPSYVTPLFGGYGTTLNPVTLTATVTVTATGQPVSGGSVTFYDNPGIPGAAGPDEIGTANLQFPSSSLFGPNGGITGIATLTFAFGPGPHSVTATYHGTNPGPGAGNRYSPSTTGAPLALTSGGFAVTDYGFSLAGPGGTEGLFDPMSYGPSAIYFNTNQDPTNGAPSIYGYGMQVPSGTTTVTDQTTGIVYPMAANSYINQNYPLFSPQFTSYINGSIVEGDYEYSLPNSGVTHFFTADIFQSGVPVVITLNSGQSQIWTDGLYSGSNYNYAGCGVTNYYGTTLCAVSTPPVQGLAADVNGDGRPELIIAHNDLTGSGSVGVFTNTFNLTGCSFDIGTTCGEAYGNPEVTYATGHAAAWVAVGDVNGDGFPDIVAVSSDGANLISILLNNGDGTFTVSPHTFSTGNGPGHIELRDFNQDGILDIAVLNTSDATIGILTGNGDGTFKTMVPYSVGTNPVAYSVADLNLDGYPDFAIANNDSPTQAEVSFLYGQPGGGFNYVQNLALNQLTLASSYNSYPETNPSPTSITATDLDGDGYPDLFIGFNINQYAYAIYNPSTQQYLYSGNAFPDTPNGINLRTVSTPVADLDGDGLKDFLFMTTVNDEIPSPTTNNLMFRLNGAFAYGWAGPDVVDSPFGNHTFVSSYTPPANSIYAPATAGPITLDIVPQPLPSLTPSALDFGQVAIGATGGPLTITLSNAGSGSMTNVAFQIIDPDYSGTQAFNLTNNCAATVAPASPCTVTVTFTPTQVFGYSAYVEMTYGSGTYLLAQISGSGRVASVVPIIDNETIHVTDAAAISPPLSVVVVTDNETIHVTDAELLPVRITDNEIVHVTDAPAIPPPLSAAIIADNETIHVTDAELLPVRITDNEIVHVTDAPAVPPPLSTAIIADNETIHVTDAELLPVRIVDNETIHVADAPVIHQPVRRAQTITFGLLPGTTYGASAFALTATASSGLPVAYTVSGPATVSGSTLTITGAGHVTVQASQAGNATFAAAASVSRSFTVARAVLTVTAVDLSRKYDVANPALTYAVTGFVNGDSSSVVSGSATLKTTATLSSLPGKYPITFVTEGLTATNYRLAYAPGTLTVTSGTLVIAPSSGNFGSIEVGKTSPAISFTVTNDTASTMGYLGYTNLGEFYLQPGTCHLVNGQPMLKPGQSCVFTAVFKPTKAGPVSGNLSIQTSSGTFNVPMTGTGSTQ